MFYTFTSSNNADLQNTHMGDKKVIKEDLLTHPFMLTLPSPSRDYVIWNLILSVRSSQVTFSAVLRMVSFQLVYKFILTFISFYILQILHRQDLNTT